MGRASRGGGLNGDGAIQRHPWLKVSIEFEALNHKCMDQGIQRDKALVLFSIDKAIVKIVSSCFLEELGFYKAMLKGRQEESERTNTL